MRKDVAIIGAGPAGMCAAIVAARREMHAVLLEASERVGSKILATGNGRCNLSNAHVYAQAYNAPEFVAPVMERHSHREIIAFFRELGLECYTDSEGRAYPISNSANSVLDVLRNAIERLGIECEMEFECVGISKQDGRFSVRSKDGRVITADKVVVATGGASKLLEKCGHSFMPLRPGLCALKSSTEPIRGLDGVRARARLSLLCGEKTIAEETGEVLFRNYGVSGIAVFNLSRLCIPTTNCEKREKGNASGGEHKCSPLNGYSIVIDFLPDFSEKSTLELLKERKANLMRLSPSSSASQAATCNELLCGLFHPRIIKCILRNAGENENNAIEDAKLSELVAQIKRLNLPVVDYANTKNAQITCGGATLIEFNPDTLESLIVPGLHACGEVLDIDGPCGGYNLHWAWASGLVCGM